ncbi:MAG: polyprenyl diphosphate synthase [Clostridiales bacterium]|nr:polyprenyl diphosphate synthase [Clostridiales bacterium]
MKYTNQQLQELGLATLPAHIVIIMDGNGRWAKGRSLPRAAGHKAGVERLRELIRFSSDAGIAALTLYAFSSENWVRPEPEVRVLCNLLVEYFNKEIAELHENQVRIRAIGDLNAFPQRVQKAVRAAEEKTAQNAGLKLNIALNYGAQAELLRAAQACSARAIETGRLPEKADFEAQLYTADLPEVDLMIRTSGEQRLSNFLLYQLAYAELYFTPCFWPDFTKEEYIKALRDYNARGRRFGGL